MPSSLRRNGSPYRERGGSLVPALDGAKSLSLACTDSFKDNALGTSSCQLVTSAWRGEVNVHRDASCMARNEWIITEGACASLDCQQAEHPSFLLQVGGNWLSWWLCGTRPLADGPLFPGSLLRWFLQMPYLVLYQTRKMLLMVLRFLYLAAWQSGIRWIWGIISFLRP